MICYTLDPLLVTPPADMPVSLAEAKAQCRIDHDDDDVFLESLVWAATGHLERASGRAFVTQTWRAYYSAFTTTPLWLPRRPVQSIESIEYFDSNNAEQTVLPATYALYAAEFGPHVSLTTDSSWPMAGTRQDAIAVDFIAGYGDPEDVPAEIKHSILILVSTLYEQREANVVGLTLHSTGTLEALMSTHRVFYV